MRVAVTGSIAMDHLMSFPGRFTEQLVPDQLHNLSLSFLSDRLEIRRGGVAANIAYGLGRLGAAPVLVGAAGADFADYQVWLKQHGVDTDSVLVVPGEHTARFVCTTDADHNQIATFHAGAMRAAYTIALRDVRERVGVLDLVVVSPNDPAAMLRHTGDCRGGGLPFVADPSQQIVRMGREDVRSLLAGARLLFTNAYESALLRECTGWTTGEVLERVGTWVTTLGADGVRLERAGHEPVVVPGVPEVAVADPTGAGDALRAGLLAALTQGVPLASAARLGCVLASFALESVGTQTYAPSARAVATRLREVYGDRTARELAPMLGRSR
ncbi:MULTISPECIES: carbohydrate kinase family protein [unclassified Streptomyces]|uniref:carbohydrate kinase family protein n=1 Tax=unclassified Streptomyces TaxID=2593676 RepID=UPI00235B5A22|nr:carbohydrate kinase family protein [Streptomyces sp. TUS-ST3]GLP70090.1 kinase [Streptomyces sp. TUS-ST3]